MNKKPQVYRICVVTREKLLKEDLFRVVANGNGVFFDEFQNMPGRGCYIKKELKTIELAQKKHSLSRGLRREVDDSIYIKLIQALSRERK